MAKDAQGARAVLSRGSKEVAMMTIYEVARRLQTTPSHIAYAHRENTTIRGFRMVPEGGGWTTDPPLDTAREAAEAQPFEDFEEFADYGKFHGLSFDTYLELDAANASSLKKAKKSIAHMLVPDEAKPHFDLGSQVHALVLEGRDAYRERTAVRPKQWDSWRTKDSKAWRDEQLAEGKTVLTPEEADLVVFLGKRVAQHTKAHAMLQRAPKESRELTYVWEDPIYGVPCKCRFDALVDPDEDTVALDIKTSRDAHPDVFGRHVVNYGYDLQAAHYDAGFLAVEGRPLYGYTILAIETEPPYGVVVYELTREVLERGAEQRAAAMEVWSEWWLAGKPDDAPYPDYIIPLELPRWA